MAPNATPQAPARSARPWREALSPAERAALRRTSAWRGWLSLGLDWGLVALALALVARAPGPLLQGAALLLALAAIGGRQLGLAVLMHEAAHYTLFRSRRMNDFAGRWLCAYPIWADLEPYRAYHFRHHARNWTRDDPDLDLATKFPVEAASLRRKIWRDLSGQVGWKRARAILARDLAGARTKSARGPGSVGWRNLRGVAVTNGILLGLLAAAGHPALYGVWVLSWLTTYSLATRIRSIAEHNMVPDPSDPLRNSRTTLASFWERLLLAPNRVNYHLEHHLLMTVPFYQLPRMHRLLRERGALEGALVERGYLPLLRRAASGRPARDTAAALV
jgi:fatty acid desaturase